MDSASNCMTPRPQTLRSSSEYHSKINSLYHSTGSNTPIRRLSSNPTVLSSTQPHRRVEGTITICCVLKPACISPPGLCGNGVCVCVCGVLLAASSTTGPESLSSERDGAQLPGKNPSSWSIEEVMQFVRDADPTALAPHAELFRKHVRSFAPKHPESCYSIGHAQLRPDLCLHRRLMEKL